MKDTYTNLCLLVYRVPVCLFVCLFVVVVVFVHDQYLTLLCVCLFESLINISVCLLMLFVCCCCCLFVSVNKVSSVLSR